MNESSLCEIENEKASAPVHSSDYWIEGRGDNDGLLPMSEAERLGLIKQVDNVGAVLDLISLYLPGLIMVGLVFCLVLFFGDSGVNCPP